MTSNTRVSKRRATDVITGGNGIFESLTVALCDPHVAGLAKVDPPASVAPDSLHPSPSPMLSASIRRKARALARASVIWIMLWLVRDQMDR